MLQLHRLIALLQKTMHAFDDQATPTLLQVRFLVSKRRSSCHVNWHRTDSLRPQVSGKRKIGDVTI